MVTVLQLILYRSIVGLRKSVISGYIRDI